jgi:hypothetical protein
MNKLSLNSIEDIKKFFQEDDHVHYYFISATNFNLMAISDWVKNWYNVNFIDCYEENNPSVILPQYSESPIVKDIESINHFLLGNKEIVEHIKKHTRGRGNLKNEKEGDDTQARKVKAVFLFYDQELEELVESLDMDLIMPANGLVKSIDNKITTTEIGNSVNVPSVPNALVKIESFSQLKNVMEEFLLGDEVVIQTAYGDSGKTTFFIAEEEDYQAVAEKIECEDKVKVMKRVKCIQVAIEACTTRNGTYIGPILTEIIGHPDLTPYKGGWCGNDVNPGMFEQKIRETIYEYTELLGKALYKKGYKGYFEVDYLIDYADENEWLVYLGEINPRITGISALTNMSAFCNQHIPLYLFHLLEFSDLDLEHLLAPAEFNQLVKDFDHPAFGQMIFKYTEPELKIITQVPETGIYKLLDGQLQFICYKDNPRNLEEDEVFILRIMKQGEYVYKGADILILFACQLLQDPNNQLTTVASNLISTIHQSVDYRDLTEEEIQISQRYAGKSSIKSSEENP